jgi:hypothetical protein
MLLAKTRIGPAAPSGFTSRAKIWPLSKSPMYKVR